MRKTYKVVVLGDGAVGKTTLINKFTQNTFISEYKETTGVGFSPKQYPDETVLQLWDVAGRGRWGCMTEQYYRDAVGCIFVCNSRKPETIKALEKWVADFKRKMPFSADVQIPTAIIVNSSGEPGSELSQAAADDINKCEKMLNSGNTRCIGVFNLSAKNDSHDAVSLPFTRLMAAIRAPSRTPADDLVERLYHFFDQKLYICSQGKEDAIEKIKAVLLNIEISSATKIAQIQAIAYGAHSENPLTKFWSSVVGGRDSKINEIYGLLRTVNLDTKATELESQLEVCLKR
jgi:small GTP-binding protein